MALPLGPNDVHLWWIDLARGHAAAPMLSWEERERAARLRRPDDRRRWIVSRAALRGILARYVGLAPHELTLIAGAHGKPALDGAAPRFSLSRGGEGALLAVSHHEVGVDLEPVDADTVAPADLTRLVTTVCTVEEAAPLWTLPMHKRRLAFLRLWVLKEAYLKGIGVGLGREMGSVRLSLACGSGSEGDGLRGAKAQDHYDVAEAPDWSLCLLDAGPDWLAALAVHGGEPRLVSRDWPADELRAE